MATEKVMEKALQVKGLKKFAGKLKSALNLEGSRRAEKSGTHLMKLKIVTGRFKIEGTRDGKTQKKASSEGRSADQARSAASRGSIKGVRSRRSRSSGRYGPTRISLSYKKAHNLILPARKCSLNIPSRPSHTGQEPN